MNRRPATQEYTYQIVSTEYFQISYHGAFLWFLQASVGLQTVEEDASVRSIFRSVREEIFEGNLPRLWILIVQELKELERCEQRGKRVVPLLTCRNSDME